MTEIKLTLDDPAQTVELLHNAARHAGGTGWDHKSAQHTNWLARQITAAIEERVKPAIEEPTEAGSLIRAGVDGLSDRVLWMRTRKGGWISEEAMLVPDFAVLHNPEVLRVGIGEPVLKPEGVAEGFCSCHGRERALDCGVSAHRREARIYRDPMDDAPEGERPDVAPEETEDYKAGVSDFAAKLTDRFIYRLQNGITAERKDAYERALKDIEELS